MRERVGVVMGCGILLGGCGHDIIRSAWRLGVCGDGLWDGQ